MRVVAFLLLISACHATNTWTLTVTLGNIPSWPDLEGRSDETNLGFGSETLGSSLTAKGIQDVRTTIADKLKLALSKVTFDTAAIDNNIVSVVVLVEQTTNPAALLNVSWTMPVEYKASNGQTLSYTANVASDDSVASSTTEDAIDYDRLYFIIYTTMSAVAVAFGVAFACSQAKTGRITHARHKLSPVTQNYDNPTFNDTTVNTPQHRYHITSVDDNAYESRT
eukprot:m.125140 g.125140  ORF g.125140 m.125140 type:complete len:224 (-) comp15733_c0_seq8:2792-3463(-)